MRSRTQNIAACLGIDEERIRRLQARGYLLELDLTAAEIRERLYRGHRPYVLGLMDSAARRYLPAASRREWPPQIDS